MGISYDPTIKKWNVTNEKTDYRTDNPTDLPINLKTDYPTFIEGVIGYWKGGQARIGRRYWEEDQNKVLNAANTEKNKSNAEANALNVKANNENAGLNEANKAKNTAYQSTLATANSTRGGDYTTQRQAIRNLQGIDTQLKSTLENYYKAFYSNEKLQTWDANFGAKPPYGAFDATYYKANNPAAVQAWTSAVANDDIDITQRYGENGFYLQHYTTQGKAAGSRGNKAEATIAANQYKEKTPTDADLQAVRDKQLGEDVLKEVFGEKTITDVKRFGALTQDVLKQTINEMKKAKAREEELSMFKGLGGFDEIVNINKELSNSIIGDSGIGGVLSYMGGSKSQEALEKSLRGVTGVNTNNTVYNWQKWFDETLKTKYNQNLELGYTTKDTKEQMQIDAGFAKEFVDKYLTPRFNASRSMDEFAEYIDVRQEEQNPFQTQDVLGAAKLVADARAKSYLDQLKATPGGNFNVDFYFNPFGNKAREGEYGDQATTVAGDWEAAKKGDEYWKTQAYRFGVNLEDKDAFARMHFQVKGQGKGYDPAEDILNASKVNEYIYTQILPALKEEALKQRPVFGQFITPDEFADEMLQGLNPEDKGTWNEVLKRYGLENFKGSIDELKEYVKGTLRTGSAQEIRENIKYLNEKKQKPTQEKLGITYIERPEDYKNEQAKPQTELYKTFQSAGFQGTEDEFYENFFPDMDRSEQTMLTKAGTGKSLKTSGLDFSDPYASLGTVESFFDTDEDEEITTEKPEPKTNSYFRIAMGEDEEEPLTKSKSGSSILGEFTSMFKGL